MVTRRCLTTCAALVLAVACRAQEELVFEDFETVENWQGFELSEAQAHSGATSALWQQMDKTAGVSCSEIPHDWTD